MKRLYAWRSTVPRWVSCRTRCSADYDDDVHFYFIFFTFFCIFIFLLQLPPPVGQTPAVDKWPLQVFVTSRKRFYFIYFYLRLSKRTQKKKQERKQLNFEPACNNNSSLQLATCNLQLTYAKGFELNFEPEFVC